MTDPLTSPRLTDLLRSRRLLDQLILEERQRLSAGGHQHLVRAAADLYGVTVDDILGTARDRSTSRARMMSCWLLRQTGLSFPDIGSALSCDHTTAHHACRAIEKDPARLALGRELLTREAGAA